MASLVADYGSDDDSDQISDESDHNEKPVQNEHTQSVQPEETNQGSSRNFLMHGDEDSDSDDDSSEEEEEEEQQKEKLPTPQIAKMKVPGIKKKKKKKKKDEDKEKRPKPVFKSNAAGSVWSNPYENAEMKKQSVLEKHVKMTEVHIVTGKKGRICKKFKMTGHCRFGKGCKYSHDVETISISQKNPQDTVVGPKDGHPVRKHNHPELPPPPQQRGFMGTFNTFQSTSRPGQGPHGRHRQRIFEQQEQFMTNQDEAEVDDDKFLGEKKRKIRVGVSEQLVPPKRALMALGKQRAEERPWTMDN